MKFEKIYRHGDVILFKIEQSSLPRMQAGQATSELVLAYGEMTGHAHRLKGAVEVLPLEKESEDKIFFRVTERALLSHEEHDTILLEPGYYLKVNQVEYNPFEGIVQFIRD
ncbi:MAG: hypothetical protein HC913_22225 [Microscillaceae bacterium]|nr:hypothetical protein [Microscillaceae bacterium]